MRSLLALPILCVLAAHTVAADATADAAKRAPAETLVTTLQLEAQLQAAAGQAVAALLAPQRAQVPDDMKDVVAAVATEASAHVVKQLDWAAVKPQLVAAYAEAFSAKELAELTAFYASPLGQRVLKTAPAVNQLLAERGQEGVAAAMPEISAIAQRIMGAHQRQAKAKDRVGLGIEIGKPFPPIAGTALDGKAFDLAAWKGKVVLVDFWATWCGPCVRELPNVKAAYTRFHDQGFEIIGISLDEDKAELTSFLTDKSLPWPQLFDGKGWENAIAQRFAIKSIPATFLIDRNGNLIQTDLRGDDLVDAVAKAIAAKP